MANKQCSHLTALWAQYTKHPSNNLALELAHTLDTLVDNYDTRLDYSSIYNVVCEMLSDYTISANCVSRLLRIISKFIDCVHVRANLVSGLQAGLSQQILYRYNQQPADSIIRLVRCMLLFLFCKFPLNLFRMYNENSIYFVPES